MAASEPVIETGVDELIRLLRLHDKLPVAEAAKMLHLPQDIVQTWIDFLVEEKMLGVEYKFTVPYVYLNQAPVAQQDAETQAPKKTLGEFKNEFDIRAQSTLPQDRGRLLIVNLWRDHLRGELERKRAWFLAEARKRNLAEPEKLWSDYVKMVMEV